MALLFVALAQAADGITLAIGAPVVGIQAEQNPLARWIYIDGGVAATLAFKAVLAIAMLAIIARFGQTRRHRMLLAAIAGGMGLFGTVGNLLAIAFH